MHAALDALFGIHGAQLTEAVWMKPGSLVVEFLPHIPKGIGWGSWTAWTHRPTPLGEIFHETDLNHVGFPLDRSSAPVCEGLSNANETLACFRKSENRWDNRPFVAEPDIVIKAVRKFVLPEASQLLCLDLLDSETEYVLYNIICRESSDEEISPHHFYWKEK